MDRTLMIKAGGIEFHAQQRGEQPRAVFVHGFGEDLHTWDSVWAALGSDLAALRYDLRGFGRTLEPDATAFSHADDLVNVLDAFAIEQCDLIGLSMGGAIALNFTLDHPERVRNLILISPGMVAWEWSAAWKALWRSVTTKARAGEMDAARQLWWQHPFFETTRNSAAASVLHESIMRYSGKQWIHDNQKLALPDIERLHELTVRTLLLTGGRDFEDFRLIADLIEASATNLLRIDHPEYGHLLHLEDPRGCVQEMLSFLRGQN